MSARLQELVAEARAKRLAFDVPSSLGAAIAKKERRARRDRLVRRSAVVLSGAALFAVLLFRGSVAPASSSASAASITGEAPGQEIAAAPVDDAGFARD